MLSCPGTKPQWWLSWENWVYPTSQIPLSKVQDVSKRLLLLSDLMDGNMHGRVLQKARGTSARVVWCSSPKPSLWDKFILVMEFNLIYPSIIQEYNIDFTTIDSKVEEEVHVVIFTVNTHLLATNQQNGKENIPDLLQRKTLRQEHLITNLFDHQCQAKKLRKDKSVTPEKIIKVTVTHTFFQMFNWLISFSGTSSKWLSSSQSIVCDPSLKSKNSRSQRSWHIMALHFRYACIYYLMLSTPLHPPGTTVPYQYTDHSPSLLPLLQLGASSSNASTPSTSGQLCRHTAHLNYIFRS